jgi:pimeloyl-ACP methyl ester carboxylesterase
MLSLAILPDRLLITIVALIVVCFAVSILAYLRQEKMIYFPRRTTHSALVDRARQLGVTLWPGDSADYRGLVSVDFPGRSKGVVMIFHGNAGSAVDRYYYVAGIQRLGYRVVLFEYPGYGARPGTLGEAVFVADAVRAARTATKEFGGPLYVLGESLGCGIASAIAGMKDISVKGVVLITPWDTLPNLAQDIYWFLPVKRMIKDKYDNIKNLRDFNGPIAVIMAGEDEIIPNKRTKRLYESLSENKRLWTLQGVGHNDWLTAVDGTWWKEVMDFVSGGTRDR